RATTRMIHNRWLILTRRKNSILISVLVHYLIPRSALGRSTDLIGRRGGYWSIFNSMGQLRMGHHLYAESPARPPTDEWQKSAPMLPSAAAGSVIHCRRSECWRALSAAGRVYPFVSHGISYAAIYQKPVLRRPVRAVRHLHCIACRNSCGRTAG